MADAWVYLDESQAPSASGTERGQPFWVAALTTEQPIEQDLIDTALESLRSDPDARGNAQDAATLARGFFHSSLDSKNAHSALCTSIVSARLQAGFSASLWFFERSDSGTRDGAALHRLSALLSSVSTLNDDYDAIHVAAARRQGSFDDRDIESFPDYVMECSRNSVRFNPSIPTRFPKIDAQAVNGDSPGVQVCDFILWAVQRARLDGLTPQGRVDWVNRLKVRLHTASSVPGAAHQTLAGELGTWGGRPRLPSFAMVRPRDLATLTGPELWALVEDIARDLHAANSAPTASTRIGHLSVVLRRGVDACERASGVAQSDMLNVMRDIMDAFLAVNDTLPVYDATSGPAWTRATEKRRLACGILTGALPLRIPPHVALGVEALGLSK